MVEGLFYSSSMNANRPAVALYERAKSAVPRAPSFHRSIADPVLGTIVESCAQNLGYRVV